MISNYFIKMSSLDTLNVARIDQCKFWAPFYQLSLVYLLYGMVY